MNMTTFIARMIMEQADRATEKGQDKYRAYFVRTKLYEKWEKRRWKPFWKQMATETVL